MCDQVGPQKHTKALHSSSWIITSGYDHFYAALGKRKFQQVSISGVPDLHMNGHFDSTTAGTACILNSACNGLKGAIPEHS